jgi:hypothetical protein
MSDYDRAEGGRRLGPLFAIVCLALGTMLSGCTDIRRAIGMDRVGPDEFAVESRAPLTIPPDYDLRPPAPGAARPQEVTAAERARRAIDSAGPGEPGKQATFALKPGEGGASAAVDSSQQVAPNSIASKLLGSADTAAAGAERRESSPLKGVY